MTLRRLIVAVALLVPVAAWAATLGGPLPGPLPLFPSTNWWNLDISAAPVDPGSGSFITFIGTTRQLHPDFGGEESPGSVVIYGIPYIVVDAAQAKKTVQFVVEDESDGVGVPFYPIPDEAITQPHWVEGGQPGNQDLRDEADRHILIVDKDNKHLYELFNVFYDGTNWNAYSGAFFDMNTNNRRPDGWTSADAAGLAILPGLVRYDEAFGTAEIGHAFRFTVQRTNGYVYPASHLAGPQGSGLPMGARMRLKASKNIDGYAPEIQRIFRAMKKYGLIVADNGSNMYISGAFDTRWDNDVLNPAFHSLTASDFEVIQLGWNPPPGPSLSVGDVAVAEGNAGSGDATFTVTLSPAAAGTVTVNWATANGTATAPVDYTAVASTALTFSPGETTETVAVTVFGDTTPEANETFFVNLSGASGAAVSDAQGQGTINNDDLPSLSINDVTVTEGNAGTVNASFTVTLSAAAAGTVTVNWATANGTATSPSDFTAVASTALTFTPGQSTKTVTVVVNGDTTSEPNETLFVNLSGASGATVSDAQGQGTITNDDGTPPAVSCPGTVPPGGSYLATVSAGSSSTDWVAQYTPGAPNTPWIGAYKYVPLPRPQTVTLTAPGTVGTYQLRLFANDGYTLLGSCNFQVSSGPALSINDVTVTEGNAGTVNASFTVTLSPTAAGTVTVNWATANGTASAPSDYASGTAALTFAPGEGTKTVTVVVSGDATSEANETFFVNLSGASGAAVSDAQGQGTITNDDGAPPALTCPGTVPPGGSYSTTVSGGSSSTDWVAQYTPGAPNTPWIGAYKYVPLPRPQNVTMTAPGSAGTYQLRLFANDTFTLISSCTFQVASGPALSINDVTVTEGNAGTVNASFTVTLSPTAAGTVTVNWGTANGTASAPSDYASDTGSLTFAPSESTKTVTVVVNGDTTSEPNETFFVNLSGASGATVSDGQGQGTITNDDGAPPLLSCPGTVPPGASYTATVNTGSSSTDWLAQYTPGAPNTPWIGAYKYVPLPRPQNVTMTAPGPVGTYQLRLFANDTYTVLASCTFQVASGPTLSIGDVTVTEGNAGTVDASFTVTLSPTSAGTVTVNWATANGTASAPSDYASASGSLSYAPGEATKTVTVVVNGDAASESNETFFVNLSGASGATVSDAQGQGTITNDDAPPALTCPGTVAPGASYTTTVSAGSSTTDWVAQYTPGAPNVPWIGAYKYVPLPRPQNVTMTAPGPAGTYQLRLFANDGYTLIGSCTFQVAAGP